MGKWTGRENSATWEVTKQVGPPAFLQGAAGPCCPVRGAVLWRQRRRPPRTSCASKPGDGPLDNNARVCEFGEINTQKSKNGSISPLNAVPREGVLSLPRYRPHSHEELPGKMFSKKVNHKILSSTQNTSTWRFFSQKAVFSHHC